MWEYLDITHKAFYSNPFEHHLDSMYEIWSGRYVCRYILYNIKCKVQLLELVVTYVKIHMFKSLICSVDMY